MQEMQKITRMKLSFGVEILPRDPARVGLTITKALIRMGDEGLYDSFYESGKHVVKPFSFFYSPAGETVTRIGFFTYAERFDLYFSSSDHSIEKAVNDGFRRLKNVNGHISYSISENLNGKAKPLALKVFEVDMSDEIKIPSFVFPETFIKGNKGLDEKELAISYFKQFGIDIDVLEIKKQSTYSNVGGANRQVRGYNILFKILGDINTGVDVIRRGVGARKSQGFGYCVPNRKES
jgi:CRISPR/Cas system endoribonuclease Cas6 (RAMP superfamily)